MTFRGFATMIIRAADVPAAVDSYTELLGTEAYLSRPGPDGWRTAYAEFRIGDYRAELGTIHNSHRPALSGSQASHRPRCAIMHRHVPDPDGTVQRLLDLGATENQPITAHGDEGFITASVVDPFGNLLGVITNPHHLEVLGAGRRA